MNNNNINNQYNMQYYNNENINYNQRYRQHQNILHNNNNYKRKKNNWNTHKKWNFKVIQSKIFKKKIFQRIQHLIIRNNIQLAIKNRNQETLQINQQPLDVKGIIYVIVHLSTNKVYVGQTINSAYERLQSHWNTRFNDDFRNRGIHSQMRQSKSITEYLVWPLEFIDTATYTYENKINHKFFRQFASTREQYWINQLKSFQPRGFNIYFSSKEYRYNRRMNSSQQPENTTINENGNTVTDHQQYIKVILNNLIRNDKNEITMELKKLSKLLRLKILRYTYEKLNLNDFTPIMRYIQEQLRFLSISQQEHRTSKKNKSTPDFIKIVYCNQILSHSNIRQVLRQPQISKLLPFNKGERNDKIPIICDKQVAPFSTTVCNFSTVAKSIFEKDNEQIVNELPNSIGCPCRSMFPNCKDLLNGHVATTNYNNIDNEVMRQQFIYGCKFKYNMSKKDCTEAISLGLEDYVSRTITHNKQITNKQVDDLNEWKLMVLSKCTTNIKNCNRNNFTKNFRSNVSAVSYLKKMKDIFAITRVDKLSHNLAMTCKRLYMYNLYQEITSNAYSHVNLTFEEIMDAHDAFNNEYKYPSIRILPYLYPIVKLHKTPIQFRFIAGVSNPMDRSTTRITPLNEEQQNEVIAQQQIRDLDNIIENNHQPQHVNQPQIEEEKQEEVEEQDHSFLYRIFHRPPYEAICSTTKASKNLCNSLQEIMFFLRLKDEELFIKTGYRRLFFMTNIDEVFKTIKSNIINLKGKRPRTFDFAKMYTNIEHEMIFTNIKKACIEAIQYQNQMRSKGTLTAIMPELSTVDFIMKHLRFVVSNTYLCNSKNNIKQQTIGIPMGTNASPEIANLTLYISEAQFIDDLIATRQINVAKQYATMLRFIDDVNTFEVTPPPIEYYPGLTYSEQIEPDGSVTFLGARMKLLTNGHIEMSVYDKTAAWTFPVIRYTHSDTNAPPNQSTSIMIGQLIRFRLICNSIKTFKIATTSLTRKLLEREHPTKLLIKGFEGYLVRYKTDRLTNHITLRKWFYKMIIWASYNTRNPMNFPNEYMDRNSEALNHDIMVPPVGIHNIATPPNNSNDHEDNNVDANRDTTNINLNDTREENRLLNEQHATNFINNNNNLGQTSNHIEQQVRETVQHTRQLPHNRDREEPQRGTPTTSNTNTLYLLKKYEDDPDFLSIQSFYDRVHTKLRNTNNDDGLLLSQQTTCSICSQTFKRMAVHKNFQYGLMGCHNITLLRYYILRKKHIQFEYHHDVQQYQQYSIAYMESIIQSL
jgi:hypothetical protein